MADHSTGRTPGSTRGKSVPAAIADAAGRAKAEPIKPRDTARVRPTTGVVFVHGIGTQLKRDTLLDWSRPIIDVLAAWRRERDAGHETPEPIGENPVDDASVADSANASIQVDVPAFAGRGREKWLFTEAYWAADVRAPSFGDAVGYIRRHLVMIVFGIARGYGLREARRRSRLRDLLRTYRDSSDPVVEQRVAELERSLGRRWALVDGLDRLIQFWLIRYSLAGLASLGALFALAIYAPLRAIPIESISKKFEIAAADTFLVDWFGDLKIILDDPSQLAAIRTRLRERVCWLADQGCEHIVLVAHSGGTIVSYQTLLRYSQRKFPVTKLVTLGEAIKLGWRLEQEAGDWVPGNALRGNLAERRPGLRWVDVWASYDPAPSGEMAETDGCPLIAVPSFDAMPDDRRIHVESRPVTNLMNLAEDHGGYWTNDEGFLIPLIRHIDDPTGDGSRSRFYRDSLDRTVRTERRRRRVSILLAWRWAGFLAAIVAVVVGLIRGVDFAATGHEITDVWRFVPGHEIVSGTINGIGSVVSVILGAVNLGGFDAWLGSIGAPLLGVALPIVAIVVVFVRGTASWTTHDALERAEIRKEYFGPPGSAAALSEGILLTGGLGGVILAAARPEPVVLAVYLVVVALVALVARATQTPPGTVATRRAAPR